MAKRKAKIIKKKGRKTKRPTFKKGRLKFQKLRNREIYDLVFADRPKQLTISDIDKKLADVNFLGFNQGEPPDTFVKLTFIFKKSAKEQAGISYVYSGIESNDELYNAITEMREQVFKKRENVSKKHSKTYAKVLRYKNYLSRIVVDFQTATN